MLYDWLFGPFWELVDRIIAALPVVVLPCEHISGVGQFLGFVGAYVDYNYFGSVVAYCLSVESALLSVRAIEWLYEKLPLT